MSDQAFQRRRRLTRRTDRQERLFWTRLFRQVLRS